ncbi:MAG: hypothetical protein ACLU9N_07135 [Clostridia bacterium]
MDIEELGMILSKNYDAIRDKNIEIENETAALERETRLRLEDMEAEIQNNIDDMKLQMGTLLSDLKRTFKSQSDEFHEDIQMDMKALETGDDFQKNLRTDLRTIKKELQADILNMKLDFRSALETLDESAMTTMADLSDRSREELNAAVEQVLIEAKNSDPVIPESESDEVDLDAEKQDFVEAAGSEDSAEESLPQEEIQAEMRMLDVAEIMKESESAEELDEDEPSLEPESAANQEEEESEAETEESEADILEEEQDVEEDSHSLPDSENFAASEEWAELEEQEE